MRKLVVMLAGIGLLGGAGLACAHNNRAEDAQTEAGTGGAGKTQQKPSSMQQETESDEIFGRSYEDEKGGTGGAGNTQQKPSSMQQETESDEIFGRSYEDEKGGTGGAGSKDKQEHHKKEKKQ